MSAASAFIQEIEDLPPDEPLDWLAFSDRIHVALSAAATSEERSELLAARAVAIEFVVRQLQLIGEQFEKFIDACELEYKRLIVQETLVDGHVSYERMLHVTDREIAAGRMSEDYALRAIAVEELPASTLDRTSPALEQAPATSTTRWATLRHWLHID
jgi:hypothetical protein